MRRVTADEFIEQFVHWIMNTFGDRDPARRLGDYMVRLRPEQITALKLAADRKGTTPTQVLHELIDHWMAEEWAKGQE